MDNCQNMNHHKSVEEWNDNNEVMNDCEINEEFRKHVVQMNQSFVFLQYHNYCQAINELVDMIGRNRVLWYITEDGLWGAINRRNKLQFTTNCLEYTSLLGNDDDEAIRIRNQIPDVQHDSEPVILVNETDIDSSFTNVESPNSEPKSTSAEGKHPTATSTSLNRDKRPRYSGKYPPCKKLKTKTNTKRKALEKQLHNAHETKTVAPALDTSASESIQAQPLQVVHKPAFQNLPEASQIHQQHNQQSKKQATWTTFNEMPATYRETIQQRLNELISPSTFTVQQNVEELLETENYSQLSTKLNQLFDLANLQQDSLTFYKNLNAYYRYIIHESIQETPTDTAMMIMTKRYGYKEDKFMAIIHRGEIIHDIIRTFGPAALLSKEYFKVKTITGTNRRSHMGTCAQDSQLIEFFKSFQVTPLTPLIEDVPNHLLKMISVSE